MEQDGVIIVDQYDPYSDPALEAAYADFLGLGNKAAREARKATRQENRAVRHDQKIETIKAKGEAGLGLGNILNSIGQLFGKGGSGASGSGAASGSKSTLQPDEIIPLGADSPTSKDAQMKKLIIWGVVAVLVVGGVILYIRSRK